MSDKDDDIRYGEGVGLTKEDLKPENTSVRISIMIPGNLVKEVLAIFKTEDPNRFTNELKEIFQKMKAFHEAKVVPHEATVARVKKNIETIDDVFSHPRVSR